MAGDSELRKLFSRRDGWGRAPVPAAAEAAGPRAADTRFPTEWARRPVSAAVRAQVQRGLLRPLLWTVTRPTVHGLDLLEGLRGPAVFVANHTSHIDAPLILCALPARIAERMAVGAASDYFFDVPWRAVTTGLVFHAFPIERRGPARSTGLAGELLGDGWHLLLFPEGTRSDDGAMARFRLGAAHCCVTAGVPAVPVALRGTHQAMPKGRSWPRGGRPDVTVLFGRPLHPHEAEPVRAFNARIETAVNRLVIQHERGWWPTLSRAAPATTGPAAADRDVPSWRRRWLAAGDATAGDRPAEQGDR